MIQPKDERTLPKPAATPASGADEGRGSGPAAASPRVPEPPTLVVFPGMEVKPQQRELVDLSAATVVDGVGETWVWAAYTEARRASSPRDWVVKRATREEARRLAELARELAAVRSEPDELRSRRSRLESIACRPNVDLLGAAESLAAIPAKRRGPIVERALDAARAHGRRVELRVAHEMAKGGAFSELRAPVDAVQALLWLLSQVGERPSIDVDSALSWLVSFEEQKWGLTGLIEELDAFFVEVTGRRPSSTMQSRMDRLSSLQLRIQMTKMAGPGPESDGAPAVGERPTVVVGPAVASAVAGRPVSLASAGAGEGFAAAELHDDAPESAGRGLLGFALTRPKLKARQRAEGMDEDPGAVVGDDGGAAAPPGKKDREPRPAGAEVGRPRAQSPAREEAEVAALVRKVGQLERELELVRSDVRALEERSEYILRRLSAVAAPGEEDIDLPPSLDELRDRKSLATWVTEKRLVRAAIVLFGLAGAILAWRFSGWGSDPAPSSSAPAGQSASPSTRQQARPRPSGVEAERGSPPAGAAAAEVPSSDEGEPIPPNTAEPVDAPEESDDSRAGAPSPPDRLIAAGSSAAGAPEGAPTSAGEEVAAPGLAPPGADAEAAPAPAEQVAERFGVGMGATHRITPMSKIFGYRQKDPMRVQTLPGSDAIVDQCILSLAARETYPKKLYPGYRTILLSCAGEMKAVCDALGCEPQQACVTAASWVKGCDEP